MNFDQIWRQLLNKNQRLSKDDSTVEFKAANLKRLLKQVYEQGQKSAAPKEPAKNESPFGDLGKMFGM